LAIAFLAPKRRRALDSQLERLRFCAFVRCARRLHFFNATASWWLRDGPLATGGFGGAPTAGAGKTGLPGPLKVELGGAWKPGAPEPLPRHSAALAHCGGGAAGGVWHGDSPVQMRAS
jgi:hypothetical protein